MGLYIYYIFIHSPKSNFMFFALTIILISYVGIFSTAGTCPTQIEIDFYKQSTASVALTSLILVLEVQ